MSYKYKVRGGPLPRQVKEHPIVQQKQQQEQQNEFTEPYSLATMEGIASSPGSWLRSMVDDYEDDDLENPWEGAFDEENF